MARAKSQKPAANWKEIFIKELARIPNVTAAARKAKIPRSTAYSERDTDADFAAAWEDALESSIEVAEGELYRRSVNGVPEPVYYQGQRVGYIRRYSDALLMFLLRSHKPQQYQERTRAEISGPNGGPIESANAQVIFYIPENGRE